MVNLTRFGFVLSAANLQNNPLERLSGKLHTIMTLMREIDSDDLFSSHLCSARLGKSDRNWLEGF